jgi:hypothetical protein
MTGFLRRPSFERISSVWATFVGDDVISIDFVGGEDVVSIYFVD